MTTIVWTVGQKPARLTAARDYLGALAFHYKRTLFGL